MTLFTSRNLGIASLAAGVVTAWQWGLAWDQPNAAWLVPVYLAAWGLDKLTCGKCGEAK